MNKIREYGIINAAISGEKALKLGIIQNAERLQSIELYLAVFIEPKQKEIELVFRPPNIAFTDKIFIDSLVYLKDESVVLARIFMPSGGVPLNLKEKYSKFTYINYDITNFFTPENFMKNFEFLWDLIKQDEEQAILYCANLFAGIGAALEAMSNKD